MFRLKNRRDKRLSIVAITTVMSFLISSICLSYGIDGIYQNLFYIPILLACFWYGKKGFYYSTGIIGIYLLFSEKYSPEPFWEIFSSLIVFITIGFMTYKLSDNIRKKHAKIIYLNKELEHYIKRFNISEMISHLGHYEFDLKMGKMVWSDGLFRIFGFEPGSFEPTLGKRLDLTHLADRELVIESIDRAINGKEPKEIKIESRILRADGTISWVLSTGNIEYGEDGEAKCLIGTLHDITERKMLERKLEQEKEKLRLTIASIGDGVISTDINGNIIILNKVAETLTGWTQEEALGKPLEQVFNLIDESSGAKCAIPISKAIESGITVGLPNHIVLISKDGLERPISYTTAPIYANEGCFQGIILIFRNVSEERRRQNRIYQMSYSDYLTGIYNRRFVEEKMGRIDTEENLPLSIIMGDVNGLKLFNDAFGHKKGDELIKSAAKAFKSACRTDDIVARWGGDEFVVLLPKTKKEEAEKIVIRIKNTCNNMKFDSLSVSIALGWATKEKQAEELGKILKIAEDYMYKHKFTDSYSNRSNIIKTIFSTFQEKNPILEGHSKRVSHLCQQIGKAMELSEAEIDELRVSGLLHDIGKIAIDKSILNKSLQLTKPEWIEIKRHSEIGYKLLSSLPEMLDISQYVLYHHERFDGKGYPRGLKGEEIPLFSRIINVADSYDAMTNKRAYKEVLPKHMAIEELIRNKGTQFDPHIIDIFIKLKESHQVSADR